MPKPEEVQIQNGIKAERCYGVMALCLYAESIPYYFSRC